MERWSQEIDSKLDVWDINMGKLCFEDAGKLG